MNISDLISQDVSALLSGNKIYENYQEQYRFLYESYIGGDEYREAGHLTRYQLETEGEYRARLLTTPLENHCKSIISTYNSFLFRVPPERDYANIQGMPELEDFMYDADMDGRSLDAFMKDVATWSSVFGHCWIIVSKPNIGATTRADEQRLGVRPYVSMLTPMVVLDWQWEREQSGKYVLSYLKYVEEVNGDVTTIREWTKEVVRTTIVDSENENVVEDLVEDNQLGMIPAVIAYSSRSTVRGIGISDIADIASQQKFIYNATSEVEQSIRLDSHPSLVKTPETQAGIGAGSLVHMPENLDPGLKPYLLEFSGAEVNAIYAAIKHSIESIDKMANTGAVRATESRTLSGVAMETEFSLLNARLSEKADNMELAEEQMWKIWCAYMGTTWNGYIDYPGSFNIRDTASEITQLQVAKGAATDPAVHKEIDKQILNWMNVEDVDLDTMEHPVTTEANRTEHIQAMIMEGYTDEQILGMHSEISQQDIDDAKRQLLEQ
jgi:hypothetical protein